MRFVRFFYYKTANYIAPCGAVHYYLWCSALLFAVRCGYAILRVVLMRSSQFVQFGKHP